jgi:hypothetical protein
MRIVAKIDGDLKAIMETEIQAGKLASLAAVSGIGAAIKADWRAQVTGAKLGARLGNSIRYEAYPKGRGSFNAAAQVFSRAPHIIGAFERGAVITAKGGQWLAIPMAAAGAGRGGARLTPAEWERRRGLKLRFVYLGRGSALLVADGRQNKRGLGVRSGSRSGLGRATVPIFRLVPRVSLRKRLDLMASARRIAGQMGARLVANWK